MKARIVSLFVVSLTSALGACSASNEEPIEREAQQRLQGELKRVIIGNPELGVSEFQYFVEIEDGRWIELVVDAVPEHAINAPVVASGHELGAERFRATSLEVVETEGAGVGQAEQALIAASPKKVAVILANYRNDTSQPIDANAARGLVFTSTSSSHAYFNEISFGVRTLTGIARTDGDVFGWITLDHDNTPCNYSTWGTNARSKVTAAGTNLSAYDYIVHYFPRSSACSFSGVGQLPGKYNWINGSGSQTISHELGHNFGVHHASSNICTNSSGQRVPISSTCTLDEYGDPFDVMGRGYRHMSLYQKGRLGWLEPGNTLTTGAAGDYTIATMETKASGVQSLRVPITGTNQYYYVEYRQPFGFDNFTSSSPVVNGISIRRATDYGTLIRPALIDNVPSTTTFTDAPLSVGATFTDSTASISITLVSRTSTSAVVRLGAGGGGSDGGTDAGPPPTCATGESEFAGHCYVRLTTSQTYDQASSACTARGAGWGLAVVGDAAENQFISGLVGSAESWLGGNDRTTEGTFVWRTGQTFWTGGLSGGPSGGAYTNFVSGEPNNASSGDCVRMITGGGWRDIGCSSGYQAVCEKG